MEEGYDIDEEDIDHTVLDHEVSVNEQNQGFHGEEAVLSQVTEVYKE